MDKKKLQKLIYAALVIMALAIFLLGRSGMRHTASPTPSTTPVQETAAPEATPLPPPTIEPTPEETITYINSGSDIVLVTREPATNSDIS